ncbi:MAG: Crp/Fnr family transcriptional regulator [Acidobacteriota bacterium]|nr:Crp/Fnr family transcriptional regulator [Acidobacteriota bacterium]
MNQQAQSNPSFKNELLAALSGEELQRLYPHLKKVDLHQGDVLHESDAPPDYVYFLEEGVAGLSVTSETGKELNLSIVGNDSTVGERAIFRKGTFIIKCEMLTNGYGYTVPPQIFQDEFYRGGKLHDFVIDKLESRLTETAQTAFCNTAHTVEQRLGRWLLGLADRLETDELTLTQDYIANMLGVHRPGVTIAAIALQDAGYIDYSRGRIAILNREELENAACECYKIIKEAVMKPNE